MKKSIVVLFTLCLSLSLVLVACGSKETSKTTGTNGNEVTSPITIKLAHVEAIDHPLSIGVKKMAEELKAKSGGRIILQDFPASQLGNPKDLADAVSNDVLDMTLSSPGELGRRHKPIMILDAPYLFRDLDHLRKTVNGPVGEGIWSPLAEKTNIRVLAGIYYGTRHVTTSKVAVKTPADMKGLKLRTPDVQISLANARGMGASPTPMAIGEVYLALQQGVIDGQENPIPTIIGNKFNEVQKYLILTEHMKAVNIVCISDKRLKSLPEDLRKIFLEVVRNFADTSSNTIKDVEDTKLAEIKQKGAMQVIQPDIEAFKQATKAVYKEFESQWGAGLYEKIQDVK
jgi:tripartite ATP-independent transporter DctP family solute receptor